MSCWPVILIICSTTHVGADLSFLASWRSLLAQMTGSSVCVIRERERIGALIEEIKIHIAFFFRVQKTVSTSFPLVTNFSVPNPGAISVHDQAK